MLDTEVRPAIPSIVPAHCHVLIVDDDQDCLDEYRELVEGLGYTCLLASTATTALRLISSDKQIGIVLTDLQMPGMDGLTLLEELSERFLALRPLVPIVVTGASTLNSAVSAMRSNAIDFLAKPVSQASLSTSLRRASSRWARQAIQFQLMAISLDGKQTNAPDPTPHEPTQEELEAFAASMMKQRLIRSKFFENRALSDTAWDILLDLTIAGLRGERIPASSACASAQVPLSTALRHLNQLVEAGMVKRELDPDDKRRTLLELESHTLELMRRYLISSWQVFDHKLL